MPRPLGTGGRAGAHGAALLVMVLMLAACVRAAEGFIAPSEPTPSAVPPTPSPDASARAVVTMPVADAAGEDIGRLPRFPGSVRTDHVLNRDQHVRFMGASYVSTATLDEVRSYYQGVILELGWERADIDYDGGQWTYVLVAGAAEALIQLRPLGALVAIDLRVSEPIAPEPPPVLEPVPTPEPAGEGDGDDDD